MHAAVAAQSYQTRILTQLACNSKTAWFLKRCLQFSIALGLDTPGTSRSGCQSQLGRNLRRLGWDESSTSPTDWSRLLHSM